MWQYSNTNYHLLAMIIRKVAGKWYGDFLAERIFQPLGMTHTAVMSEGEIVPNRAMGYLFGKRETSDRKVRCGRNSRLRGRRHPIHRPGHGGSDRRFIPSKSLAHYS